MKIRKWEKYNCQPCANYDPVFKKVMEDWNVEHDIVNVEDNVDLAREANITLLPTTSIYDKSGKEVYRLQGVREATELVDLIKEFKDA